VLGSAILRVANALLSVTGLGDTIVAIAEATREPANGIRPPTQQ
jgi:ribosomal protein S11